MLPANLLTTIRDRHVLRPSLPFEFAVDRLIVAKFDQRRNDASYGMLYSRKSLVISWPTKEYLHIEYQHMEILQGTLDMLVLKTLILGPLHGYGIARAIKQTSNDTLDIEFGSLYPALKRLEVKGWIASKWEMSEMNRRAKFYRLTPAGRKQLVEEHSKWAEFVEAVTRIMGPGAQALKGSRKA